MRRAVQPFRRTRPELNLRWRAILQTPARSGIRVIAELMYNTRHLEEFGLVRAWGQHENR